MRTRLILLTFIGFLAGGDSSLVGESTRIYSLFPQVAIGSGWSCDVFATNQDVRRAELVTVAFYGTSGDSLDVNTNLGSGNSFSFNLDPGATQVVRVSSNAAVRTGYALLSAPANSSVRASLVFYYRPGSQPVNQLGVPQVFPSSNFSFAAEIEASLGVNTGLAVCNPNVLGAGALQVVVSLIDEAGSLAGFKVLRLEGGAHMARFLSEQELFPGLQSFRGSVNVSAIRPFGLIALRSEQASVGSLTINASPVVGPFAQTAQIWTELEPNDTTAAPQVVSLPTRIAGGFDKAGDVDVFRFTGKKGDAVTALTEVIDPSMDPTLALLRADGAVLVQNDQNGLLDQKDAFLQAVLPADGTYFIRVQEAGQKVGPPLGYEVHIRVLGQNSSAPGMVLNSAYPVRGVRGNTITLELRGTDLCPTATVAVVPPDGISISDVRASATVVNARLTISPSAALGSRWVSVNYAGAVSNALPLEIAGSGSSPPRISNLQVSAPYSGSGHTLIRFAFNFTDSDADIVYRADDLTRSAKMLFIKSSGSKQCRMQMSNLLLNQPGKTSGSFLFGLVADDYVAASSGVTLEVIDAAGNISNALTFTPAIWQCGP